MDFCMKQELMVDEDFEEIPISDDALGTSPLEIDNVLRRKPSKKVSNRRCSASSGGSSSSSASAVSAAALAAAAAGQRARHKAGHASYAELISQAICSLADRHMTLSQIYDWMADHVACLRDQRSLHSSKGWKNAVRHTLSINPRFKRLQRQGRPGLWTVETSFTKQQPPTSGSATSNNNNSVQPLSPPTSETSSSSSFSSSSEIALSPVTSSKSRDIEFLDLDQFRIVSAQPTSVQPGYYRGHETWREMNNSRQQLDQEFSPPTTPAHGFVSHHGQISPTSNAEFSYSMPQGLWVIDRTGQPVYVTFPGPVKLSPKKKADVSTQTYICQSMTVNSQPSDHSCAIDNHFYPQDPSCSNFGTECGKNFHDGKTQILSSTLPDDLQDINLDKSIDWGLTLPGDGKYCYCDI